MSTNETFVDVNVNRYESLRRTMARFRKDGQPQNPQSMEEFSLQLDGPYRDRAAILGVNIYAGTVRGHGEEGCSIIFITPETRR